MYRPALNRSLLQEFFRKVDYLQLVVVAVLLTVGLVFIRSIGLQIGTGTAINFFSQQLQWVAFGTVAYIVMAAIDYRKIGFRIAAFGFYLFCLFLLLAVLIWGKEINNAHRWLIIGGYRLQPSEPAKIAVVTVLAGLFASRSWQLRRWWTFLLSLAALAVPFFLIVVEPDLGSALMLAPIYFAMIFVAGLKWRYILAVLAAALLAAGIGFWDYSRENPVLLRKYQRDRIRVFLDPQFDIQNRGHQPYQARLGVGSGGLYGKGLGNGTQNALGFLPQMAAHNDFIFSVIAEETGFCGVMLLLLFYSLLFYTILRTAFLAPPYGRLLAVGVGVMLFFHVFINIGMSIGVAPVSGLSLPLVSYGGSFIVITMAALGLMQSIRLHGGSPDA